MSSLIVLFARNRTNVLTTRGSVGASGTAAPVQGQEGIYKVHASHYSHFDMSHLLVFPKT